MFGIGREKVRAALGLAVWEAELAAETGLLRRMGDRSFDPISVKAAQADPDGFRRLLARERRCNATDSAARLGIDVRRFKRVAAAAGLKPVVERDLRQYGRTLHVLYYRAGDVDALGDHVAADIALRSAATAVSRKQAATKAAATRQRNAALAKAARAELAHRRSAGRAVPIDVLTWTVALMRMVGVVPGPLRRLAYVEDPSADDLTELLLRARLAQSELETLLDDVLPRAFEAAKRLAGSEQVSATLGIPAWIVAEHIPQMGGHLPRAVLRELAEVSPPWLLRARAGSEPHRAAAEAARQRERDLEHQRRTDDTALDSAMRATDRLTDAAVAELLGLSEDVVRRLRPGSGRWSSTHVGHLLHRRPAWSLSEEAARAEGERRQREKEAREQRKRQRKLDRRRTWARLFDVPLEAVPENVGRPTHKAVAAAKAHPPRWTTDPR